MRENRQNGKEREMWTKPTFTIGETKNKIIYNILFIIFQHVRFRNIL